MYTLTKQVFDTELGKTVETTEEFHSHVVAKERFRKLKRGGEYDYLRLADADNKTLARWRYGEEDEAHAQFMDAANTAEAEKPFGPDAYKMPVIKDRSA